MKTIVIWDQCGQESIQFFIVNGNKSHWDNHYINTYSDDNKVNAVLLELEEFFESTKIEFYDRFPNDQLGSGDIVVVSGFLP